MVKIINLLTLGILFIASHAYCIDKKWLTVEDKENFTLKIPETLEVQGEVYNKQAQKFIKTIIDTGSSKKVVIQQKGLNDKSPDSIKKYCRIIIETFDDAPGQNLCINTPIELSKEEFAEMDKQFISQQKDLQSQMLANNMSMDLKEIYPFNVVKLGNANALLKSYLRSMNGAPSAYSRVYIIGNYDRRYTIAVAYRVTESSLWANDFEEILKSFDFVDRCRR